MKQAIPVPFFKKSSRAAWSLPTEMVEDYFDAEHSKRIAPGIEGLEMGVRLVYCYSPAISHEPSQLHSPIGSLSSSTG